MGSNGEPGTGEQAITRRSGLVTQARLGQPQQ